MSFVGKPDYIALTGAICVGGPVHLSVAGRGGGRGCLLQDRCDIDYRFPHKSQSMKCPVFVFLFCYCFDIDVCYLEITLLFEWA